MIVSMIALALAAWKLTFLPIALAHALLASPASTPEVAPTEAEWLTHSMALQEVAVSLEIMDERERSYVLSRYSEYLDDLNLLRRRHEDLANSPRVVDAASLPDRHLVNGMVSFNRAFRKNIEIRSWSETDRIETLVAAINETDELYRFWDAVRDAKCDFYYVTARRQALKRVRDMLGGGVDYLGEEFPPVVPTWRFVEIK